MKQKYFLSSNSSSSSSSSSNSDIIISIVVPICVVIFLIIVLCCWCNDLRKCCNFIEGTVSSDDAPSNSYSQDQNSYGQNVNNANNSEFYNKEENKTPKSSSTRDDLTKYKKTKQNIIIINNN